MTENMTAAFHAALKAEFDAAAASGEEDAITEDSFKAWISDAIPAGTTASEAQVFIREGFTFLCGLAGIDPEDGA